MKARILSSLRKFLIIWGAFSLVAIVGLGAFVAYQLTFGNKSQTNTASAQDVWFILNWCELGEGRIEKVVHSYTSSRSFTGDHMDAHEIKISHLEIPELAARDLDRTDRWYRGDQLPPVVDDAIAFVGAWDGSDRIPWFPKESELRSANIYVFPVSICTHGVRPTAVELIFVRPSDNTVFYFGSKT
jgi:hypothetical protein